MEIEHTIEYGWWWECQSRVVVMNLTERRLPIYACHLVKVLDDITTQSCVTLNGQPWQWAPACLQLSTHTIAVLDVCSQIRTDITLRTSLYKLVVIVHIIEVHPCSPVATIVLIAHFDIHHTLWRWCRITTVVGEVITFWLTTGMRNRSISLVTTTIIADTCFRIDEVITLVDV